MGNLNRPSESQAINMSKLYGLTLSEKQISEYVTEREKMGEAPLPDDLAIFERVLTAEQKEALSKGRLNRSSSPKSPQSRLSIHPLPI